MDFNFDYEYNELNKKLINSINESHMPPSAVLSILQSLTREVEALRSKNVLEYEAKLHENEEQVVTKEIPVEVVESEDKE